MLIRGGVWLLALVTTSLFGAAAGIAGCGKDEPVFEDMGLDAGPLPPRPANSDAGSEEPQLEPEPEPEPEAGPDLDSGVLVVEDSGSLPDAAAVPVCEGQPNGTPVDGGGASRCCSGKVVALSTRTNCGGCGIKCPAGMACEQPVAGKWGCRCATDLSCQQAGYGTGATCYDPGNGKAFCNCQCAVNNTTCNNRCAGGATCSDMPGQNYCYYPLK